MWKLLKEHASKYGTAIVEHVVASNKSNELLSKVDAIVAGAPKRDTSEKVSQITNFATYKAVSFAKYLAGVTALYYFEYYAFLKEQQDELLTNVTQIKNIVTTSSSKVDEVDGKVDELHGKVDQLHASVDQLHASVDASVDQLQASVDQLQASVDQLQASVDQLSKK